MNCYGRVGDAVFALGPRSLMRVRGLSICRAYFCAPLHACSGLSTRVVNFKRVDVGCGLEKHYFSRPETLFFPPTHQLDSSLAKGDREKSEGGKEGHSLCILMRRNPLLIPCTETTSAMSRIEVTEDLLMSLGWKITVKKGRTVSVEPPQDGKFATASCFPALVLVPDLLHVICDIHSHSHFDIL